MFLSPIHPAVTHPPSRHLLNPSKYPELLCSCHQSTQPSVTQPIKIPRASEFLSPSSQSLNPSKYPELLCSCHPAVSHTTHQNTQSFCVPVTQQSVTQPIKIPRASMFLSPSSQSLNPSKYPELLCSCHPAVSHPTHQNTQSFCVSVTQQSVTQPIKIPRASVFLSPSSQSPNPSKYPELLCSCHPAVSHSTHQNTQNV